MKEEANTATREETPAAIRAKPLPNIAIKDEHTHTSQLAREPLRHFGLFPLFLLQPRAPVKLQQEPRVPLELQQVTQSSFRVMVEPPLELQWGR